eukprot:gb/GECG01010119.1/.p1 GENE.gb/GECG01010119.1/~~gb/GECG01010119.1/.p1  ORF type:complete len:696 (+),score=103.97 gb/GECG01010119.1/:1-2088(+)
MMEVVSSVLHELGAELSETGSAQQQKEEGHETAPSPLLQFKHGASKGTIKEFILNSDLRALGGVYALPRGVDHIDGPALLQITAVVNLSVPSYNQQSSSAGMMGVKATDGQRGVMLVEVDSIKQVVNYNTPPGTKIQVRNATISQNRLILIEKGAKVVNLGGTVNELKQTWETNKRIQNQRTNKAEGGKQNPSREARASLMDEEVDTSRGPPQFIPFSEDIVKDAIKWMEQKQKASKKAVKSSSGGAAGGNTMNEIGAFARGISKDAKRKMRDVVAPPNGIGNAETETPKEADSTESAAKPKFNAVEQPSFDYRRRRHETQEATDSSKNVTENKSTHWTGQARQGSGADVSQYFDRMPTDISAELSAEVRLFAAMSLQSIKYGGKFECTVVGLDIEESTEQQSEPVKFVLEDRSKSCIVAVPSTDLERELFTLGRYHSVQELRRAKDGEKEASKRLQKLQNRFGNQKVQVTLMFAEAKTIITHVEEIYSDRRREDAVADDILQSLTSARPPQPPDWDRGSRGGRGRGRGRGRGQGQRGRGRGNGSPSAASSVDTGKTYGSNKLGGDHDRGSTGNQRGRGNESFQKGSSTARNVDTYGQMNSSGDSSERGNHVTRGYGGRGRGRGDARGRGRGNAGTNGKNKPTAEISKASGGSSSRGGRGGTREAGTQAPRGRGGRGGTRGRSTGSRGGRGQVVG